LDIKCSNLELEVKGWEIKSQCLEQQNESSQKEIEALTQELEEYKQITNSLKASIVDIKDKKGKEILALSEKVLTLEEKLRKQKIEYDFLMVEKKEVEQELSSLRHLNYQSRIENLEDAFAESEEARKALQEELQQSENRLKLFLQHQKENSISAKVK